MEKLCEIEKRTNELGVNAEKGRLTQDLILFTIGFLFTRCHLVFGAHPISLAFLAALPTGVWSALLGGVVGGFSMGLNGIIFSASGAIIVFLRAAVSADNRVDGQRILFSENLLLRMSISILGGFISSVYEVLLRGLSEATLAFGICMVIAPPILTFIFSGLFSTGINWQALLHGPRDMLSLRDRDQRQRYELIFFIISALTSIFFIGLSIKAITAFGISALYIFSGLITLLTAKRFGGIYGMAVGFASSLSGSGVLSVAFALAGLCSGGLFGIGTGYAIIIGGVALAAFSGYSSGLSGLLATLPEYIIASAISLPLLKRVDKTDKETDSQVTTESPEDMLGTMALVYQNEYIGMTHNLNKTLSSLSDMMEEHSESLHPDAEAYRIIAAMMDSARQRDLEECAVDNSMTESLTKAISEGGFDGGIIRAFGKHRPHFIIAGKDNEGRRITSFELRKSIENVANVKLSAPEFFRRGQTLLMECGVRRKLSVTAAIATSTAEDSEMSGDCPITFETSDDYFCALLCDGMGSGLVARKTADFATKFIKRSAELGTDNNAIMLMLNKAIKSGGEECSSTVDLFKLDLVRGDAEFIKSGAAPSFVKRESSIFRIRSHTAPIGLMSSVDSERTKAEIKPGDHIILMSDGVSDESEDAPWLLLLLGETPDKNLNIYAERILAEAKKNRITKDDMSVIVIRVNEI
jgi:serine/threonine protein phosphatase PrpC